MQVRLLPAVSVVSFEEAGGGGQRPCLDLPYYSVLVEEGTLLSSLNCISRLAALDFIWKWCIEGLATYIRLPLDKCCY